MLNVRLDGFSKISKQLKEKRQKFTTYREYFENFATPALFKRFDEIFQAQGAVSNFSRWQRLRLATLAEKKRRGYRLEILRRTDRLYNAYRGRTSDTRIAISPDRLIYRNLVPYGGFHETGTSRMVKRTVIARLLAYKEFKRDLSEGMQKYLDWK